MCKVTRKSLLIRVCVHVCGGDWYVCVHVWVCMGVAVCVCVCVCVCVARLCACVNGVGDRFKELVVHTCFKTQSGCYQLQ